MPGSHGPKIDLEAWWPLVDTRVAFRVVKCRCDTVSC